MKVTKKVSVGGQWAKLGKDFDEGDVLQLVSAGETVSGEFGDRLMFKVKTKNGELNLSFNQTSINHLIDAYGDNTSAWEDKNVKVWVVDQNVQGKIRGVVYLTAPDWKKVRVNGELKFVPSSEKEPRADSVTKTNAELAGEELDL